MTDSNKILLTAGIQNPEKIKRAFDLLIKTGLKLLNADEGSLLVYRKEENDLQFVSTIGKSVLSGKTVPVGKGITGMAAMTGEIQTATRALGGEFFDVSEDGSPNSIIAAPVMIDDELIGIITAVSFDKNRAFSTSDCQNFSLIAALGAIIITQSLQIENYSAKNITNLTEQSSLEMKVAQTAVDLVRKNPDKGNKILEMLSIMGEL